ncbi:hypothetical protein [Aquibium sp. ELW1220]|uniref:hypothetical protein n=1 Tax=Aquibium sp. ELW1220 TaxID=2976766 RepID=UPI0025B17F6B|nr:hypothetical protein [Aquibium sp. ELW1220]MDN2584213.1 hypothetical protein [Aquibium sp. ELW1220]
MMRRRAILHIGTEKTGTTAIQNRMRAAAPQLARQGVIFSEVLGPGNHTHLVAACMEDDVWDRVKANILATHLLQPPAFRARLREEFAQALAAAGDWHTVIGSSELIHSRLLLPSEIDRLFETFRPHVDEIEVVLFLRRQDRLALSRFSTALRGGFSEFDAVFGSIAPSNYFRLPPGHAIDDMVDYFDYRRLIERFLPHLPIEKIKVVLYPEDMNAGTDSVAEFIQLAGLDAALVEGPTDRMNLPMPVEAQYVMSEVNKLLPMSFPSGRRNLHLKKLHTEIEATVHGTRRQVRRADAEAFVARYGESNEWVRTIFFPERESLFSDRFNQYPDEVDYSRLRTELAGEVRRFRQMASSVPQAEVRLHGLLTRAKRWLWPQKLAAR